MTANSAMQNQALDRNEVRDNFAYFIEVPTRWNDNDQYGHVNNAVYHNYIEAVIMRFLVVEHGLDVRHGAFRTFTVENFCRYHRSIAFPHTVECGLRVAKLGNSSVRYEVGLFIEGSETAAATAYCVDVYVDPHTERPVAIPAVVREILTSITR